MTATDEVASDVSLTQRSNLIARLGLSCMAAALLSGVLKGIWELASPILSHPEAFASVPGRCSCRVSSGLSSDISFTGSDAAPNCTGGSDEPNSRCDTFLLCGVPAGVGRPV